MRISDSSSDVCSSDLGRAGEDEEEGGIEERTLPYGPIETDGLKEARQQDPEHESDGHAEQQRREEHAGEVDLADHDAGIHAGARSNSAMRSPASERIARVTGLLFWLSRQIGKASHRERVWKYV